MTTIIAEEILLPDGWASNVLIEIDEDGFIIGVHTGTANPSDDAIIIKDPIIPGMANAHSHGFQRAMAGLTERASGNKDSFWSWRKTMYRFLENITPEILYAINAQTYVEMLKAGYTSVAEFHYLHHQKAGVQYDDNLELSLQSIQAAIDTCISITHMPVLYCHGGFNNEKPGQEQLRFINKPDDLVEMVSKLSDKYKKKDSVEIGFAYHSLRAVSMDLIKATDENLKSINYQNPIHIHVSEQLQEVEECYDLFGQRPVEYLLNNIDINDKWSIVHATHANKIEIENLAKSNATTVICPTTEANLGDGIFPMLDYLEYQGSFAIGSDSHVSINPVEELRWLEYGQRLITNQRTLIQSQELPSVGASLFEGALKGGEKSLGKKIGRIEVGYRADMIVLDGNTPALFDKHRDHILDSWIFSANSNLVKDVIVGGRWVVKDKRHIREEEIFKLYQEAIAKL